MTRPTVRQPSVVRFEHGAIVTLEDGRSGIFYGVLRRPQLPDEGSVVLEDLSLAWVAGSTLRKASRKVAQQKRWKAIDALWMRGRRTMINQHMLEMYVGRQLAPECLADAGGPWGYLCSVHTDPLSVLSDAWFFAFGVELPDNIDEVIALDAPYRDRERDEYYAVERKERALSGRGAPLQGSLL